MRKEMTVFRSFSWVAAAMLPVLILTGCPPAAVTVPALSGLTQAEAAETLAEVGLTAGAISEAFSTTVEAGLVINQNPAAGEEVDAGSAVNYTVSLGPETAEVPDVSGMTESAAVAALTAAGFTAGTIGGAYDTTVGQGLVLAQSPAAGELAALGAAVDLTISLGPPKVAVPDLSGMTRDAAAAALATAGLSLGAVVEVNSGTVAAGLVVAQNPAADTLLALGGKVKISLSLGPAPVTVPEVTGMTREEAESALVAADLTVGGVSLEYSATVASGLVISQDPAANASAMTGDAVNLVVSQGAAPVAAPNLVGLTQQAANSALAAAGLQAGAITHVYSATVAEGIVLSQTPAAGTSVAADSAVDYVVSLGALLAETPDVIGLLEADAVAAIVAAALLAGQETTAYSDTVAAGRVIEQNPAAYEQVAPGTEVTLVISLGPASSAIPNITGMLLSTATSALVSAGFSLGTVTEAYSDAVTAGKIISQTPPANTLAIPGTAVNVVVSKGPEPGEGEGEGEGEGQELPFDPIGGYDASDYTWDNAEVAYIALNGTSIVESTEGASAADGVLTISASGTYSISGNLSNGRIVVDVDSSDNGVVRLIFNGVNITCLYGAPFYVANAKRTAILLPDGTANVLTDPSAYSYFDIPEDEEPNAALFSKDYLTVGVPAGAGGSGRLTVNGNYNDGITSKDGVIIEGGTIVVHALDDGIRGKDYLIVKDGDITVTTEAGDGFKSDNDEDATVGFVVVENGAIQITAEGEGIQAQSYLLVDGGGFEIQTGGGAGTAFDAETYSKKGLKAEIGVLIQGGSFYIDSADDAIHSAGAIVIDNGTFEMYSGDDGIHADATVDINGGDISIMESYEGVESIIITIRGGNMYVVSSDDGLNCADGSGGLDPIGPPQPPSGSTGEFYLYIYGGYLAVYAQGDGLDSNGDIIINGGTVVVHGPTRDDNSILDYGDAGSSFLINGGLVVGAGSSGMPTTPGAASKQKSKVLTFSQKSAGTLCHIESASGQEIMTFAPAKVYESVIVSSPNFVAGTTYNVYFGGTYAGGTNADGMRSGGTYSGGTVNSGLRFTL